MMTHQGIPREIAPGIWSRFFFQIISEKKLFILMDFVKFYFLRFYPWRAFISLLSKFHFQISYFSRNSFKSSSKNKIVYFSIYFINNFCRGSSDNFFRDSLKDTTKYSSINSSGQSLRSRFRKLWDVSQKKENINRKLSNKF